MKTKLSISINKELVKKIEDIVNKGRFRNKSHILEYSLKKFIEDKNES